MFYIKEHIKQKVRNEIFWLTGAGVAAAGVEYLFIILLDLHPALSLIIQGFIGLLIIAYGIRMIARIWMLTNPQEENSETNGPGDTESGF